MSLTPQELEYLAGQHLGRLATVDPHGAPQNNPVGFRYDESTGTILIGGYDLGRSRKFRNIERHPQVAFVVDDLASVKPWRVRGVEIRGRAEALRDTPSPIPGTSPELIRIHPELVFSWGLGGEGMSRRRIEPTA
ncbi:PPOX class F420-dependent oxidoreductase [Plantactinospora siamensis]|uniref:PPOX class F420-dependent oxidoreductase n=1 Tax=Plantactinospora siamensis TaxID=555372 RepID=A0ABV6NYK5_9ACTN